MKDTRTDAEKTAQRLLDQFGFLVIGTNSEEVKVGGHLTHLTAFYTDEEFRHPFGVIGTATVEEAMAQREFLGYTGRPRKWKKYFKVVAE